MRTHFSQTARGAGIPTQGEGSSMAGFGRNHELTSYISIERTSSRFVHHAIFLEVFPSKFPHSTHLPAGGILLVTRTIIRAQGLVASTNLAPIVSRDEVFRTATSFVYSHELNCFGVVR